MARIARAGTSPDAGGRMAKLLFVYPESNQRPVPPVSFSLLPHAIDEAVGVEEALLATQESELIVVDARTDPAWARHSSRALAGSAPNHPLLLLVTGQSTPLVAPDWGFDDFVLDEAPAGEVDARIRMLLMRQPESGTIVGGPIVIDEAAYTVTVDHQPLDLTYTEFELLKYLVTHPGRVLTRENLLSEVWGYDYYGGTRTVDVHIRRLRAKLGPEFEAFIGTVRNVGYRFAVPQQRSGAPSVGRSRD